MNIYVIAVNLIIWNAIMGLWLQSRSSEIYSMIQQPFQFNSVGVTCAIQLDLERTFNGADSNFSTTFVLFDFQWDKM